ncbi:MAG: TonB family protein [Candidatus Eremiobacteraeota bacterium]|nr:TonB family protein [Candidatus Eremiobacteraeota bacterium]NNM92618.1 TonB family protein [Candidatus Eremiobacteraeota bacterium]
MRVSRYLWWALAISLFLHVLAALFLARNPLDLRSGVARITVQALPRPLTIARQTPIPPTPPPTPRPRLHTAVSTPLSKRPGPRHAVAAAPPTAAPRPPPTPHPSPSPALACIATSTPPRMLAEPTAPPIDPATRAQRTTGTSTIAVAVDALGAFRNATIQSSSGNAALDVLALQMAKNAEYAAATRNCRAVAGTMLFRVKFQAW